MKIQIAGLSEGLHEYRLESPPVNLGLGEEFHTPIVVDARLEKTGREILLDATIATEARFICDRCLSEFTLSLAPAYQMFYVNEGSDTSRFDPSEVQVVPAGYSVIDISEDVRQIILLAVPLKLLCSHECKGLCPSCGTNLNTGTCTCAPEPVDSRWEALRALKRNS